MVLLSELLEHDVRILKLMIAGGDTVIVRSRSSGRERHMPVRSLYQHNPAFYRRSAGEYEYWVSTAHAQELKSRIKGSSTRSGESHVSQPSEPKPLEPIDEIPQHNFGDAYNRIASMTQQDRLSVLQEHSTRLQEIGQRGECSKEQAAVSLAAAGRDGALVNRAAILEALSMSNEEARAYTSDMVAITQSMMDSTALLLDDSFNNQELINAVAQRSNGIVVQHMTRVFLLGYAFLLYYNRQVLTSNLISRIRVRFSHRYKSLYHKLLPHLHADHLTLEHVYLGGMRALQNSEITLFAAGFLMHDVGKIEDIEYHEGEEGYVRDKVIRHVYTGYNAIRNKTSYAPEIAMITGFHHEYYGDDVGYGLLRDAQAAAARKHGRRRYTFVQSYERSPVLQLQAVSFFPAKMLEIVDIYDALTDVNRRYRSPVEPLMAIEILQQEYVYRNLRVDPVLLDLFINFLISRGVLPRDGDPFGQSISRTGTG